MLNSRKSTYARPPADTRRYSEEEHALNEARGRSIASIVSRREDERKARDRRNWIKLDIRLLLLERAPMGWTPYVEDVRVEAGVRRARDALEAERASIRAIVRGGARITDQRVLDEITDAAMRLEGKYTRERAGELVSTYIDAVLNGRRGKDAVDSKASEWIEADARA